VKRIALFGFGFLFVVGCCAQTFEFSELTKLPSTVNSGAEEGMPLLSADGKRLFFTRAMYEGNDGGEFAGQDIWVSDENGSGWGKAGNQLKYINNKNNNVVVGLNRNSFYGVSK
jgi:hypothetical protein